MLVDKKIRFLIPTVMFFNSILWWMIVDQHISIKNIILSIQKDNYMEVLLTVLAGGSVVGLAFGFLFGAAGTVVTQISCKLYSCLVDKGYKRPYNAWYTKESYKAMWACIIADKKPDFKTVRCGGLFYEYGVLKRALPEVGEWCARRWDMYRISCNSGIALLFSLFFVWRFKALASDRLFLPENWIATHMVGNERNIIYWWVMPIIFISIFLFYAAWRAWYENNELINFVALHKLASNTSPVDEKQQINEMAIHE